MACKGDGVNVDEDGSAYTRGSAQEKEPYFEPSTATRFTPRNAEDVRSIVSRANGEGATVVPVSSAPPHVTVTEVLEPSSWLVDMSGDGQGGQGGQAQPRRHHRARGHLRPPRRSN